MLGCNSPSFDTAPGSTATVSENLRSILDGDWWRHFLKKTKCYHHLPSPIMIAMMMTMVMMMVRFAMMMTMMTRMMDDDGFKW